MSPFWSTAVIGVVVALVAGVLWRRWRTAQLKARKQLAMLEFDDQRSELAEMFLAAASATGKPRGLRWKSCELGAERCFAEDRATGELLGLAGATISFEAIEGGDMEDVEAVGNLRGATAVFIYRDGRWTTDGRTVFNLEPAQTLERFSDALAPIACSSDSPARDHAIS